MRIQTITLAALAALSLAACRQAEQDDAQADANDIAHTGTAAQDHTNGTAAYTAGTIARAHASDTAAHTAGTA